MALKAVGIHTMKFFNTAGAIPGIGTAVGAGRIALGFVVGLIALIGILLSSMCCAKDNLRCLYFKDHCKKLTKAVGKQILLGFFELIPGIGTALHCGIDESEKDETGKTYDDPNKYMQTYFKSCKGS